MYFGNKITFSLYQDSIWKPNPFAPQYEKNILPMPKIPEFLMLAGLFFHP